MRNHPVAAALAVSVATAAVVVAVAVGNAPPAAAQDALGGKDVVVTTDDGMKLAATWWDQPAEGAPGVVLLHMFRSDRNAWSRVIEPLRSRGVEVLAIDLRGHGGSAKQGDADLAPRVEKRDATLFAEMHRDATAAVHWLVSEGKCDPKRIALVGASVGCSVALDAASRHPGETAAVLCLSPGAKYLDIDTLEQVKKLPAGEPVLLLVHQSELEAGAPKVHEAIAGSRLLVYDEAPPSGLEGSPNWAHGTRMFDHLPLVEQTVASFVASALGSKKDDVVLDGVVAPDEPWSKDTAVAAEGKGAAWAYRLGNRIEFAGKVPDGKKGVRVVAQWRATGAQKPWTLEMTGIDAAAKRVEWRLAGPDDPEVRVVTGDGGTTFEGEWILGKGPAKDDADLVVKFVVEYLDEVPAAPGPDGAGAPPAAVELPTR